MMKRISKRFARLLTVLAIGLSGAPALAQLDSSCLVSAFNRTAPVEADGTWVLPSVPANLGKVRLRATCVRDGVVTSGQSEFIEVPENGVIQVAEIRFDLVEPVPERLLLGAPGTDLAAVGETLQLVVTAEYPGGDLADVSAEVAGTRYRSSSPGVASVGPDGLVTALASGVALISATNEGALGLLRVSVVLSGDSDGDGLPDDWELANGLDPNDPDDALLDHDSDGLSTLEEYQLGLDPFDPDVDGDGLLDGAEVNTWGTEPLLFDTDGDGLSDGLEVRTGSDPLDRNSFNLVAALASIGVSPASFTIVFNTILGEASRQLGVVGNLIDGARLDITSSFYGTTYISSDLIVANFGADSGRVFAGRDGATTVTVANAGFSADASVTVESFSPVALSFLPLGGAPRAIAVDGGHAYVAMGFAGLKVVDVSDPEAPFVTGRVFPFSGPPFRQYRAAEDVAVEGSLAFVAAGGLALVDVASPTSPEQISYLQLNDVEGRSIAARGGLVLLGGEGYQGDPGAMVVVDASDPVVPVVLATLGLPGAVEDLAFAGSFVVVATGSGGVQVIDLSDPAAPAILGSTHTRSGERSSAVGVAVAGELALVADGGSLSRPSLRPGGLRLVDLSDAANPAVVGSTSEGFGLTGVVWDGTLALTSDYFFVSAVPVFRLGDAAPIFTGVVDFSGPPTARRDNGVDLAVGGGLVYKVGVERASGQGGLDIGRYLIPYDGEGVPPTVAITSPEPGVSAPERELLFVAADARDDIFVQSVAFLLEGETIHTDFAPPFSAQVPMPVTRSSFSLSAVARDAGGNETTSEEVLVLVDPNEVPVATIRAPIDGAEVDDGELVAVVVSASDDDAVRRVEIYADGVLAATDDRGPSFGANLLLPASATPHAITIIAYDDVGPSPSAGPVRVTVVPDQPPQALILEPADGSEVIALSLVEVVAGASDAVGVERVRFYQDGALFSVDTTGPDYRAPFASPEAGAVVELQVVARDSAGQETPSAPVQVTVVADPLTTVQGLVVGLDQSPFEGAEISVRTSLGTVVTGLSGEGGVFVVEDVPSAQGALTVEAIALSGGETLAASLAEPLPAAPGGLVDAGVLALSYAFAGSVVRGRVEDDQGNAIAGALVRVHDRFQLRETVSGSSGEFEIARFEVHDDTLLHVSGAAVVTGSPLRGKLPPVFPDPFGETNVGTLVLTPDPGGDPGTTATGELRDDQDRPLEGLEVVITTDSGFFFAMTVVGGRFSVAGVPALDGGLVAGASGLRGGRPYRAATEEPVPAVPGGVTDLSILYPFGEGGGGGG